MTALTQNFVRRLFRLPENATDSVINQITTDSRPAQCGDLFFALVGENHDAHDFVPDVLAKGATAVVSRGDCAELSGCLKALAGVLGLLQREPHEFLQSGAPDNGLSADAIEALIAQRNLARANKNWAESDRIRDELAAQGVVLRDAGGETTWTRE